MAYSAFFPGSVRIFDTIEECEAHLVKVNRLGMHIYGVEFVKTTVKPAPPSNDPEPEPKRYA